MSDLTVALLHAYRAANRGDGWLVSLSRQLVSEATGLDPVVYALDPDGMGDGARAVFPPPLRMRAAISLVTSSIGPLGPAGRRIIDLPHPDELTAAIGIGGGYFRGADPIHELVFRAHHLPQLRLVAAMGTSGAYLPVSVGPFRRGLGRLVRRLLGEVGWVATRDDRSARYLAGWANGWRLPDLAACRLGIDRPSLQRGTDHVVAVALRSLPHSNLGYETVTVLEERGFKIRLGVQSSSGRTNDDRSFYEARGLLDQAEDFGEVLTVGPRPAVVLAGRLHAALGAIAAGYPTIHLGYERKSAGAFADLGLTDYVVDAWTGEPRPLADLVTSLATDPEPYWERLAERFDALAAAWTDLCGRVEQVCSSPRRSRRLR